MRMRVTLAILALGSATLLTLPAQAQAVGNIASQSRAVVNTEASNVTKVGYRHRHWRHRHYGHHRHWGHRHYGRHRHWGYRHYRHRPRFGIYLGF